MENPNLKWMMPKNIENILALLPRLGGSCFNLSVDSGVTSFFTDLRRRIISPRKREKVGFLT